MRPSTKPVTGPAISPALESLRQSYHPGCQPHYIQVIKYAHMAGCYEAGVLLSIDGWVVEVLLEGAAFPSRLGTLWTDRLARVAQEKVRRDAEGRPIVQWNRKARVLQLFDLTPEWGLPSFNVVDLDVETEYLAKWKRLANA